MAVCESCLTSAQNSLKDILRYWLLSKWPCIHGYSGTVDHFFQLNIKHPLKLYIFSTFHEESSQQEQSFIIII